MERLEFLKLLAAGVVCSSGRGQSASDIQHEWDEKFRKFVKAFNLFMMEYNDGKMDYKLWGRVIKAFEDLTDRKQKS